MEQQNKNYEGTNQNNLEGTATHSGWQHFYSSYARYRDECVRLGRLVMGNNLQFAVGSLSDYHTSIYTLAQQVFSFYELNTETQITSEWLDIGEEINTYLILMNDPQFRSQMVVEGEMTIPKELKVKLLTFFNKVDRMATDAGLNLMKENKDNKEPKKGMLGFK